MNVPVLPAAAFGPILAAPDSDARLGLLAELCRANALAAVKLAGSGHMGSSLSAVDLMAWLHFRVMNTLALPPGDPGRDIFFSSKGHDAPALYAVLHAAGRAPEDMFTRLRRRGGYEGHPVVGQPGVEAGTGSLGMGLSKGAGMLEAKRLRGLPGRVCVMTGDGELQEGQNYEALRRAAARGLDGLLAVVDCNRVQSDRAVADTAPLGDLAAKFAAFGWAVEACDGHDFAALDAALRRLDAQAGRPKALIAATIKGRGVSFMEHPRALAENGGVYRWHSGAPSDADFRAAHAEVLARAEGLAAGLGLASPGAQLWDFPVTPPAPAPAAAQETIAEAYGRALAELGAEVPELVALDADLAGDCRLGAFAARFPERFFEIGIAEQDMVSAAGGMALQGLVPVVNSFAAFLAARANEQIYANACEGTKVIYACHYAGLLPAAAGMSHQSVRDIALLAAIPGMLVAEPADARETADLLAYLVREHKGPAALRLQLGGAGLGAAVPPLPFPSDPAARACVPGRGTILAEPGRALVFACGPVMLAQAVAAAALCADLGLGVAAMPWLNRADAAWLAEVLAGVEHVFVLDDHSPVGGLGASLLAAMTKAGLLAHRSFAAFGVEGLPACGQPAEALAAHGLDAPSLARRVRAALNAATDGENGHA